MAERGVAVTRVGGGLACGHVIHVSADRFRRDWSGAVTAVLQAADAEGMRSIALPALGTGLLRICSSLFLRFFSVI